jgi:hypothetical protein
MEIVIPEYIVPSKQTITRLWLNTLDTFQLVQNNL